MENHQEFHKLPQEDQDILNEKFQEYKANFKKCSIELVDDLGLDIELNTIFIDVNELQSKKKKAFDRAKTKKETQKLIDEDMER